MKKTLLSRMLALFFILMLTASLAACGGSDTKKEEPAEAETAEEQEAEEPAETETAEEPEAEEPAETETAEEPEAEEPAEEPAESEAAEEPAETEEAAASETTVPDNLLGKTTETSYVNDFFGISYEVPANWYILSKDEVAQIMGMATSNIDDEDLLQMFQNAGYITDFYAMDTVPAVEGTTAYNNVNVTIQDIGKLYGLLYDEKAIAEASVASVEEGLKAQGLTDIKAEISEMEFLGKNCVTMTITSKVGDINMYQKQVYLKNDSAMAAITASTIGDDKTDEILSAFAAGSAE